MQLLSEEQPQTQTPNVHEASTNRMQQQTTLDTKAFVAQQTNTNEMLQVNIWLEHNYAMPCTLTPRTLTPLPSPKGVCRMRTRPPLKPFFYQRLEKLDYFGELTAQNIADYQLQCTSLGKPYLQAKIRTTRLRTVLSGDILASLLPRYAPDLVKNLHLLLQYLGEFHFNTWEQRQQRKLISKCAHRTLHTLCAHILLLFFEYSTPFQVKCMDLGEEKRDFEQRNNLSVATASVSRVKTVNMLEDLSLAIDSSILTEMAALKRNL
uniref:GTP-binding nuclear protein Ran n=1 Tax=Zeugodacus cucurbitae TaxID=28588 RepID=A0A0A1WXM1_ZEUCU